MIAVLEAETNNLDSLLKNLKKTPNRQYTSGYLIRKLAYINSVREVFKKAWQEVYKLDKVIAFKHSEKFESLFKEVKSLLDSKSAKFLNKSIREELEEEENKENGSEEESDEEEDHKELILENLNINTKQTKMATFDYNAAQKLPTLVIEKEENREEKIRDFLNGIEFYHDLLKDEDKPNLVKFIIKCKIQGKALTELGTITTTDFKELKRQIKAKCGCKDSIEIIQTKLNNQPKM